MYSDPEITGRGLTDVFAIVEQLQKTCWELFSIGGLGFRV